MNRIFLLLLILWLKTNAMAYAQGDLMISPKRVVFEGNKQKEELSITNIGKDSTIYSISFVQYNMTEEGSFKQVDNSTLGQWFADPYLRVFPRKVVLAPGESQTVRLQLRRKTDMASGEYRSHLYFRSEKENKPLGTEPPKNKTQMNVQLTPVYGISIPTIIRIGQTQISATLSDLKMEPLNDSISTLKLSINRSGNCSLYGDLVVDYIPTNGKPIEVGVMRGVGVYTCINKRVCSIKLNKAKGLDLHKGKLRVRLTSPKDSPYELYDEKEL